MRVLGIIPARGGSKGVPRKNLTNIAGKPLIAYTIKSAIASRELADVIVSTDDEEIAIISQRLGAEVPFIRPAEYGTDGAPTIDVVKHAIHTLASAGRNYDAICLLQPTSPIRREGLIDECIKKFTAAEADSLVTISTVPHQFNPMWVYWKDQEDQLELVTGGVEPVKQRQLLPAAFIRDGCVYLARSSTILERHSLFGRKVIGHVVKSSVNIDGPEDCLTATKIIFANDK